MQFISLFFLVSALLFTSTLQAKLIDADVTKRMEAKHGVIAKNRLIHIDEKLLKELKNADEIKKLNFVNTWVNLIPYKSDKSIYGISDYWATLYEFVGHNKGDCEDYTIAKYYILKELGVSPSKMKFTYVIYRGRDGKNKSHMVLSYFKTPKPKTQDEILILDNNNRLLLPASKRPDLVKMIKMINGDTGPKSKKWKELEDNMKRKKL